jgi:FixJ family two-component response regulator
MSFGSQLAIVSSCRVTRAAAIRCLLHHGHAEPFEGVDDLMSFRPRDGVVFIEDVGSAVEDTMRALDVKGELRPVVAFSATPEVSRIVDALDAGAIDYLAFPFSYENLRARLPKINERWAERRERQGRAIRAKRRVQKLTPRQRQVLGLLARGETNKSIAAALSISHRTVEIHRAMLMQSLDVSHSSEAIRIALESDQLEDDNIRREATGAVARP